jgi:cyanophycinase
MVCAVTGSGVVALVGGAEWTDGATFDAELLERGGGEVLVLPTAAAYEHPARAVAVAEAWFAALGGRARPCMVLNRADAENEAMADEVRASRFVYLSGGSPLHLRSVLKDSRVWEALVAGWHEGAVVAGSSAGAMVLTDPMVDPRGGAFTLGLGLLDGLAVVPHLEEAGAPRMRRTVVMAPAGVAVVGVPERTAVIREPDGKWREAGQGGVVVYLDGRPASLDDLPT